MPKRKRIQEMSVYAFPIVGALVAVLVMATAMPRAAFATASIGKKTGQPCAKCHTAAPTLNAYGKKYQAQHK